MSKNASQPTLGYSSPSVSRTSLTDLVDDPQRSCGITADVGLTLEPVTIQPTFKPMPRVRSATLCVDTVQHMSANATPALQPQMVVMGRDMSFERLAARAMSPALRPVPSMNGFAMASAHTSGNSLASALKRGSQVWDSSNAGQAREVSIEVRDHVVVAGQGGSQDGWRAPHPATVPPTGSEEQEEIGLALDMGPSPSFALQRQRSMSSAVVPGAAQSSTPVVMYSPLMANPVWLPSSHARAALHSLPLSRDKGSSAALNALPGVQTNPFYKVSQPGSSQGMSNLAKQLDLPINGVRYEECVICRCPGQCDDDRCCRMPRHFECELANQRANVSKWVWNEETGAVELPCSACRQTWGELQPSDPLVVSAITKFIADCKENIEKRQETIRAELVSSPEEQARTKRRRMCAFMGVTPLSFGVTAAGLAFGLKGALSMAALLPISAAVGILLALLAIKGIEHMRYRILLSLSAELAEAQTDVPAWMHKVLQLAKEEKKENA